MLQTFADSNVIEDSGPLGCDTALKGKWFLSIQRKALPSSSRFQVLSSTHKPWTFEEEGKMFPQNYANRLPSHTVSHPRKPEFSIRPLWKPTNPLNYDIYLAVGIQNIGSVFGNNYYSQLWHLSFSHKFGTQRMLIKSIHQVRAHTHIIHHTVLDFLVLS